MVHRMMDMIDAEPDPHMARVKMDAIKWMAGKLNRADFGDEPQQGVSVTINNDGGSNALQVLQERISRKRAALKSERSGESMLTGPGGRVEMRGVGEGEAARQPHDPASGT
jgi:hypothetical protein